MKNKTLFAVLSALGLATAAPAQIVLMSTNVNDGSFESIGVSPLTGSGNVINTGTSGSGNYANWSYLTSDASGAGAPAAGSSGFIESVGSLYGPTGSSVALWSDGTGNPNQPTAGNNGRAVSTYVDRKNRRVTFTSALRTLPPGIAAGSTLNWSFDVNALIATNDPNGHVSLGMDFGGGVVDLSGNLKDTDVNIDNFTTKTGSYVLTAGDLAAGTFRVVHVLQNSALEAANAAGEQAGRHFTDNIRITVTELPRDPWIGLNTFTLFGDLRPSGPGLPPVTNYVTITNRGATLPLNVTNMVTGASTAFYSVTPATVTLAPATSALLEVIFTPPAVGGVFTAALNVASDDSVTPSLNVTLNAQVTTDPDILVTSPAQIFGTFTFDAAPSIPAQITNRISVIVRNNGVANALTLTPVITGPNAASYSIVSAPVSIPPGTESNLVVALAPGGAGDFVASLEVTHNDADAPGFTNSLNASVVILSNAATLLAFYSFDDTNAPFADSSTNALNITTNLGTVLPVYGATNGFKGTPAYGFSTGRLISPINVSPSVLPAMTWGAWVRTDSIASGLRKILGHDNGPFDRVIGLDNRNAIPPNQVPAGPFRYTTFTGTNFTGPIEGTPGPANTNDWTFLAATYDQAAQRVIFYLDLDAGSTNDALLTISEPGIFNDGLATFAIGGLRPDNANEPWAGAIDNVFVFNGALTDAEVKALRDHGGISFAPDVVRITSYRRNLDGTSTLTWDSNPRPGTTYAVRFFNDITEPLGNWADDNDSVPTQETSTTYTTVNVLPESKLFFIIRKN